MTQPTSTTRNANLLWAYVAVASLALGAAGFVGERLAPITSRARRDEAGFGEISQGVAMGALGVLAVIAGFTVFRPVMTAIITKIKTDVLGQN
ncbi:MAG: hypothetical protein M3066_02195 [Actinomycetota bacterium]|nr:hypothetical protein [Actinomycetota bacterium]